MLFVISVHEGCALRCAVCEKHCCGLAEDTGQSRLKFMLEIYLVPTPGLSLVSRRFVQRES
ncbi:hypothetical protein JZ751_005978 [Albula glossodonta]|uniref:Uncharacterized protein n=1 Tax=Albula glossodonta TaxID=121402 RepID=A0A8T2ML84_9TELE|nr:hypothetical protein JZ751_007469 [Albula glossodonta]KAG9347051.1 hypothetical protein JZ751_005978 [Albula glossodonta]